MPYTVPGYKLTSSSTGRTARCRFHMIELM